MNKRYSLPEEIIGYGDRYNLTTTRFMEMVEQTPPQTKLTREGVMKALIGNDYETLDGGTRNLIFTTLIQSDLETAVEIGELTQIATDEWQKT